MIEIIQAGLYTTIQDNGRTDGAHMGIPVSGAMDRICATSANQMLDNDPHACVLECTLTAPSILFHADTTIAITGALIQPFVNGKPSYMNIALRINEGDILSFGKIITGNRVYIAVRGGFLGPIVMNSQSVCITSNILSVLKTGDRIPFAKWDRYDKNPSQSIRKVGSKIIRVVKGPEYDQLLGLPLDGLFTTTYKVLSQSNRMAYRVEHSLNLDHTISILSSGTLPGTVQLTPAGELIFLMRDAQTTGGYPRVLQLTELGICDMAQLKAGEIFVLELEK